MVAVSAVIYRRLRGRDPDKEQGRLLVEMALATGSLPQGHASPAWRRALTEESWQQRQTRWIVVGMTVVVTLLVVAAAVIDADPAVGALAVALTALAVLVDRWCARRVRRAEDLLAQLDPA
jgi:cobalamin synthase